MRHNCAFINTRFNMAALLNLQGIALLEHDCNGDTLWTWKYPSIESKLEEILFKKCAFQEKIESCNLEAFYGRFGVYWYYFVSSDVGYNEKLPKVVKVGVVIICKDFNPEMYSALGKVLLKDYLSTGTPVSMLELFISVFTRGKCQTQEGIEFKAKNHPVEQAFMNTCLKEFIPLFGIEFIIIYTALLLGRRVVVLANQADILLKFCRSLPALVWHRRDWNILYPYVELNEDEINDIKSRKSYVAGFLDIGVEARTDLYDVLVNVSEGEITINPNSKAYFQMGKLHKDVAMFLVACAQDGNLSEAELIEELHGKTEAILTNLKSLAQDEAEGEDAVVTLKMLQSRNLSPAMQTFLYNLAHAEGLTRRAHPT